MTNDREKEMAEAIAHSEATDEEVFVVAVWNTQLPNKSVIEVFREEEVAMHYQEKHGGLIFARTVDEERGR